MQEDILKENPERFVLFPIQDKDAWNMYKKAVASFWTPQEIDFSQDVEDWPKLSAGERNFISRILAFFAAADGIVVENLGARFMNEVQLPEMRCFYGFQIMMENIHSEAYSLMIDTLIKDTQEKKNHLEAIKSFPYVKKKADWALSHIGRDTPFSERLIAFACVEGIFFSGSFCALFWLKSKGIMPGLTFSNELISRDEALHTDFAALVYKRLKKKLEIREIKRIVQSAVDIEVEFVHDILSEGVVGMSASMMEEYIKHCADRLVISLGLEPFYNAKQPFSFMQMISLQGKTNFFERRVSEYQKFGVMESTKEGSSVSFSTDSDF